MGLSKIAPVTGREPGGASLFCPEQIHAKTLFGIPNILICSECQV